MVLDVKYRIVVNWLRGCFTSGGWSIWKGSSPSTFDINGSVFFNQQLYGSSAFFNLYVSVDDTNSSRYSLMVSTAVYCIYHV